MHSSFVFKSVCFTLYGFSVLLQDAEATKQLPTQPIQSHDNFSYVDEDTTNSFSHILFPRLQQVEKHRIKRKVISRGAHYIIRGKMGSSPWGSSRSTVGGSVGSWRKPKRRLRNSGWIPTGVAIEDTGDNRYSSRTLRRYSEPISRPRERKRISKILKGEIAQYALRHGTHKAVLRYSPELGRRLKEKVIEKFAKRYMERKRKQRKH